MGPVFPCDIFRLIVHETDDFATMRALCLTSKAVSTLTTPRMLRLAIDHDSRRIRDPGFLVYGGPGLFENTNTVTSQEQSGAETQSDKESGLCIADHVISNHPGRCEQEIRDAAAPVVLWAALQPPRLATKLLSRVRYLEPKHIWSYFLVPSTACRHHWPWPPHLAVGHALEAPLHVAARNGNTQVVRWLLKRRNLAALTQSVLWPHLGKELAVGGGMDPINLPAIQPCVCPSQHLKVHFQNRPVQATTDLPWAPALHIALAHRQLDTAALLVDWGADWATGQHGTHGITALMVASANALLPFLDHLLDSDQAFQYSSHFHPATIDWEDSFSITVKEYTMAVGNVPERRMLSRRLAALEARFSRNLSCQ